MAAKIRMILVVAVVSLAGCPRWIDFHGSDESSDAALLRWNRIAIDTSGLDHSAVVAGEIRTFGHQLGPGKSSRAMAIVHIAMYDAASAISGGYETYSRIAAVEGAASIPAAVAQAAHDTLLALYPSHAVLLSARLLEDLDGIRNGVAKERGIEVGARAAQAILALRESDGAEIADTYEASNAAGRWRPDPINPAQQPLGPHWHRVKPFVLSSATQFRCPPPPAMNSAAYAEAYQEVLLLGGDGETTPTIRTEDQTQIGIYWAYDGTPSLCAPPRLYNQIATQLALEQGVSGIELARLLALVNVAMADAGIAIWESKYYYDVWRPVTGIRESDAGTGPTGAGDGDDLTAGDPEYVPLCAPASNLIGKNFTPPFPSYPSGHAGFGGALFQTLREFFGTDDVPFTFVSDEYNGVTTDNEGAVRPLLPRTFESLSQAEEENGQSRIYLGIHWRFDKVEGIAQGRKIASHAMRNAFRPLGSR